MRRGRSLLLAALAVPAVAAAAVLALGVGRGDSAVCELERFPEQAGVHADAPPPDHRYNSFPPTSGPSSDTPLVWEVYREPVSQFRLVHNLLHGGIAVQYGDGVSTEAVDRIRTWYEEDPAAIVVAPLPTLDRKVALTAWTSRALCGEFDERAFSLFLARHRFSGPEQPPRAALQRGRGGEPNPLGLRVEPRPVRERGSFTLVYAEPATVSIHIRRGGLDGPVVRTLPNVSLLPGRPVQLRWEAQDDAGRPLPPGAYLAFADARSEAGAAVSTAAFTVR